MRGSEFRNNMHFQENFQDSQMNRSDYAPLLEDNSVGRAVQLVRIRPNGKIQVDQDALDIVCRSSLPVGFCCIAGKYRTGKSFLLNKLLKLEGNGFRVDPSTNACTQGIWMWTKPLLNERQGNYIYFIDTQGTASLNRDTNNDAKIFTLANLISSYFIYNSVGSIDQKSISELNMVTQLSKNIMLEQTSDMRANQQNLYRYMPKFLWLLRDFTLEPTDRNGRRMKPAQYLEDVLFQQNNAVKSDENTKKIRRALTKYYKDRDCLTLVRPAYEERDLQNLNQLPEHALRRDFIEGVNTLRDKILKNAGPKTYQQSPLYGSAIASMLQSYVNTMNNGGIPSIHTAWQQINQDQGSQAYQLAIDKFNKLYAQNFSQQQPKGQQIHSLLRKINQQTMDEFRRNLDQPNPSAQSRLKQFLQQKQQKILQINKQLLYCKNISILRQVMLPVVQKIQLNSYDSNPEQLNSDLRQASKRYNQLAKGEQKSNILSQFTYTINQIALSNSNQAKSKNKPSINQQQQIDKLKRNYQKEIETKDKQLASLREQNQSKKTAQQVKMVSTVKNKDNRTNTTKEITKKPVKGCCGVGGDKCSIM